MRPTRQGPARPHGGADDIADVVLAEQGAVILLPLVPARLLMGDLAALEVQRERGVYTML